MTRICISLSLSEPLAWSLPKVIKLVIYCKQHHNPVKTSRPFFHKVLANVLWREEWVLNGYRSDVIWISFSLFHDGCGAGFVCLNVSTLEELHSCGRPDHIGGFTVHSRTHTDHTAQSHSDRRPCWAGSSTTQSFYLSVVKPDWTPATL